MEDKHQEQLEFSRFLAQLGHELRTPLNAIQGFGQLMLEEHVGPLNDGQKKYLSKMTDSAQNLLLVVDQILDWAKIESNQLDLEREPLDLCSVALEVGNLLELELAQKQLVYQVEPVDWAWTNGDRGRIRQVLVNLVGNSIKFTEPGGQIQVRFTEQEDMILTQVQDSGCGLNEELLQRLFEPFSRGADRKSNGLGLWICRSIIALHQGHIWAQSQPGEGTTISFVLPRKSEKE